MSIIGDLLDAAKEKTGSDYKTAKLLGITPQKVCDWRSDRPKGRAQPEDHALVAQLAGLDPEDALVRAIIEKHADTPKGERLLSALGKGWRQTGAAVMSLIFGSVVCFAPAPKAYAGNIDNV